MPAARPPLLLLPGALGAAEQLTPLADALAGSFHVSVLDFEGHGPRPGAGRPFRLAHFAENVLDALRAATEPVRLFGYSMGGYAALVATLQKPTAVHSVVTLGTKFVWDEVIATEAAAWLVPAAMQANVPAFAQTLQRRHLATEWEEVVRQTADCLRDLGARPLLTPTALARITCPVRVAVGDRDNTVSVKETATAAHALPAGELLVLPGVAHPLEKMPTAQLAAVLTEFFTAPE